METEIYKNNQILKMHNYLGNKKKLQKWNKLLFKKDNNK